DREFPDISLSQGCAGPQDYGHGDLLAEIRVGHSEGGCVNHLRTSEQNVIHFLRRHLLAASVDDVLRAAGQVQMTVGIEVSEIAGPEPVPHEGPSIGFRILVVSGHADGAST